MKIKASHSDHLFRAVLTKAVVPDGLGATFDYDPSDGDSLQLDTPFPVSITQAFTKTSDPTRRLRAELRRIHKDSANSGLLGDMPAGRWYFVNWDLDLDRSNRCADELEQALQDLNRALGRQRGESSAALLPFPRAEVEQLLALPYFETYEFNAAEAVEMAADLERLYAQVIEQNLYEVYRREIEAGTVNDHLKLGLAQLSPDFLKPLRDYPWAAPVLDEYLAEPEPRSGFFARLFRK